MTDLLTLRLKVRWLIKLCALSVGTCLLLLVLPVNADSQLVGLTKTSSSIFNVRSQQHEQPQTVLKTLAQANVVYLGETHDRSADHIAQLEMIQALHRLRPKLAIGMEMFQRPYQSVLNRYLTGSVNEAQLQELSQYQQRWGYPWEFYAPILRFARENKLSVIALNTPTEVTRKVARTGLESLTFADRRFVPPRSAIVLSPDSYRQRLQAIYNESHHGKSNSTGFERFFQAQVLWDETMAEQIAQTLQQSPNTLVVVLVGQGHLIYGDGIPARVARRIKPRLGSFTQVSVLLNPPQESQGEATIADYLWYSSK